MTAITDTIAEMRRHHRRRRFAMKEQQRSERSLESFLRENATDWSPSMSEAEREIRNKMVHAMIKSIRDGDTASPFADMVLMSDQSREPWTRTRDVSEKAMGKLAMTLPVYPWIESIRGAGALGLATIVAETGDLANYPNPAKVWSRLGFAPYDGFAGSSWKRETWRPRALTKEEWIEHPFSGSRYALMHQIAVWLVNAQWIGKAKSESGEGEPNGPYGDVYAARRKHAMKTHADWTDGHRRMDALRITMKAFLKDLWVEWHRAAEQVAEPPPKKKRSRKSDEPRIGA